MIMLKTELSTTATTATTATSTISCQQTNIPFINKYQPQCFAEFEQLEYNGHHGP